MKIVEDSANRLVLKESALSGRIVGVFFVLVGLVLAALPFLVHSGNKPPAWISLIGLVAIAIGVLAFISAKSDLVEADKAARQLRVTFKSLKDKTGQSQVYPFDAVASVQLFQQYHQTYTAGGQNSMNQGQSGLSFGTGGVGLGNNTNNMQTSLDMNLAVQLKDGTSVTIANEQKQATSGLGISSSSLIGKGQKLADAIGVPFQEMGAATPGQVVQALTQKLTGQPESFAGPAAQVPQASPAPQAPVAPALPPAQPAPPPAPTPVAPPEPPSQVPGPPQPPLT